MRSIYTRCISTPNPINFGMFKTSQIAQTLCLFTMVVFNYVIFATVYGTLGYIECIKSKYKQPLQCQWFYSILKVKLFISFSFLAVVITRVR